jgi:hypothetical protein
MTVPTISSSWWHRLGAQPPGRAVSTFDLDIDGWIHDEDELDIPDSYSILPRISTPGCRWDRKPPRSVLG